MIYDYTVIGDSIIKMHIMDKVMSNNCDFLVHTQAETHHGYS